MFPLGIFTSARKDIEEENITIEFLAFNLIINLTITLDKMIEFHEISRNYVEGLTVKGETIMIS